jgi:hypothetical protein
MSAKIADAAEVNAVATYLRIVSHPSRLAIGCCCMTGLARYRRSRTRLACVNQICRSILDCCAT